MVNYNFKRPLIKLTIMKKILLLSAILSLHYFSNAQCLNSNLSLVSISGTGPYTVTVRLCVGGGKTGTTAGASHNTQEFAIGYYATQSVSISSFSPATFTAPYTNLLVTGVNFGQVGAPYLDPIFQYNTFLDYFPYQSPNIYQCISSTASCGNINQHCVNYTVVLNRFPRKIIAIGVEGESGTYLGCDGSPNMLIDLSTLPLKFSEFKATKQNTNVLLNWKTENEVNVSNIELERSSDGIGFTKIVTIPAKNQAANDYSYIDNLNNITCNNAMYYRLKQIDLDGNYKYSSVVTISCSGKKLITISPNPASSSLSFKADNVNEISMVNMTGQVVYKQNAGNSNLHTIDVSKFSPGIYMLSLIYKDGERSIEKVQVIH
jgi:hypothetical protein